MNAELEMKLTIDKNSLKKLMGLDLVKSKTIAKSKKTQKLINVYYDTPSYKLTKAGMVYRIRQNGVKYEATIKTETAAYGGFSERNEFTLPVSEPVPPIEAFAQTGLEVDLRELMDGEELQVLFSMEVNRELRLLQVTKKTVIEMANDVGQIVVGAQKLKIVETELEIKSGNKADLLEYAAQIAAAVPCFVETRSKFARGLSLLDNSTENVLEEKKPRIDYKGTAKKEFLALFAFYADRCLRIINLLKADATLQSGADKLILPCLLKLQALLALTSPLLCKAEAEKMQKSLTELIKPLQEMQQYGLYIKQWQSIESLLGNKLVKSGMAVELLKRKAAQEQAFVAQVQDGLYTRNLFRFLAYSEKSKWQKAEYVIAEQLLVSRLQDWHEQLVALAVDKGSGEPQMRKMLDLVEKMVYVYQSIAKSSKIFKNAKRETLEDLYKKLFVLHYEVYSAKALRGLSEREHGLNWQRDIGLILGWRLRMYKETVKELLEAYKKI